MSIGSIRLVAAAARRRERASQIGIKVNLYNALETEGVLTAIESAGIDDDVESVMVGDSYLMTHLGRDSTYLPDRDAQDWFLGVMVSLVSEVSAALRRVPAARRPLLIADLPDGSAESPQRVLAAAGRLTVAGADLIKLEIAAPRMLPLIETLVRHGHSVVAHLGYTPQAGQVRRYGETLDEAIGLFQRARAVRDHGACSVVLELVSEPVNRALSAGGRLSLPVYSIFSGKARGGGQSLNVWDSVFVPDQPRRYFPPTASEPRSAFPSAYTVERIHERMRRLLALTLSGEFPRTPPTRLAAEDLAALERIDPWDETSCSVAVRTGT